MPSSSGQLFLLHWLSLFFFGDISVMFKTEMGLLSRTVKIDKIPLTVHADLMLSGPFRQVHPPAGISELLV